MLPLFTMSVDLFDQLLGLSGHLITLASNSTSPYWESELSPIYTLLIEISIRECGSTLYVGLAHAIPPTNTNFRLTFLLTQLQEALYEGLPV